MVARRVAGLLVTGLLWHLVVVRPLVACAEHAAGAHHGRMARCDDAAMHGVPTVATLAVPTVDSSGSRSMPGGAGGTPDCCLTIGSCNALSLGAGLPRASRMPARGERTPASTSSPRSRIAAPDPPPPKP